MLSPFDGIQFPAQNVSAPPGLTCSNPKLLSDKKEEVWIRLPPIGLAASAHGLGGQKWLKPEFFGNDNSQAASTSATVADHLHTRHLHMAMFGGILIHIVFFGLGLRVFLGSMHFGIRNDAGNGDGVADVRTQLVAVALEFPSATLRRCKFVFVSVIAFLQAARERPCFIVSYLRRVDLRIGIGDQDICELTPLS